MWVWLVVFAWGAEPVVEALAPEGTVEVAPQRFTGTWVLDLDASDDIGGVLKAQGVGALQRSMARNLVVTQTIDDRGDAMDVAVVSSMSSDHHAMTADGVRRPQTTKQGFEIMVRHTRGEDGTWKTETSGVDPKGKRIDTTMTRLLEGEQMVLVIAVAVEGETPIRVRRVFRKKA